MRYILSPISLFLILFLGAAAQEDGLAQESAAGRRMRIRVPTVERPLSPFSFHAFPVPIRPKIGLVLSGGGARGLAQIGVIKALEEAGIVPDLIVGTSIGSIAGGLYAAGYSVERLEAVIKSVEWDDILRLSNTGDREYMLVDQKPVADNSILTLSFDGLRPVIPLSVSNGQRLTNLLNELALQGLYHSSNFDEFRIPFRAIATDLYTGNRVILREGNLADALRASSTVPVVYAAVSHDSMALVDGGLISNIPVDVARDEGCDIIIAVNTTSQLRGRAGITNPLETLDQVFNVLMDRSNNSQLALADFVITPPISAFSATDFNAHDSLIACGYSSGRGAIEALSAVIDARSRAFYARALSSGPTDTSSPPPRMDWVAVVDQAWPALKAAIHDPGNQEVYIDLPDMPQETPTVVTTKCQQLRTVALSGSNVVPRRELDSLLDKWTGKPMNFLTIRSLLEHILEAHRVYGFSLASIDSVQIDTALVALSVVVEEGIIDSIAVEGNIRTNRVVILRELPFTVDHVFRIADLRSGMLTLSGLNLFHQVSIDVSYRRDVSIVTVRVEERPSQALRITAQVNDERNAQLGLSLRDANLLGSGTDLSLSFFGGAKNRRFSIQYLTNRIFYTALAFTAQAYHDLRDFTYYTDAPDPSRTQYERTPAFVARRAAYGGSVSAGVYARQFGKISGTLRFERQTLTVMNPSPDLPSINEDQRIVAIGFGTMIDTQDRTPYPRRGANFLATYASSQAALGSEIPFTRILVSYDLYVPFAESRLVFHPRVQFGFGDRSMPRTEEFRLGGMATFYGMRENEFTGRQLFLGSLELRYRLPQPILFESHLSVRYDLGRTWEVPDEIKFGSMRHGIGAALGMDTPIGPADFGVGRSFVFAQDAFGMHVNWGPINAYFSIGFEL